MGKFLAMLVSLVLILVVCLVFCSIPAFAVNAGLDYQMARLELSSREKDIREGNVSAEDAAYMYDLDPQQFVQELDLKIYDSEYVGNTVSNYVFKGLSSACSSLVYLAQYEAPDVKIDKNTNSISSVVAYITYFAVDEEESARIDLQNYSEKIIAVIQCVIPDIEIKNVCLCWNVTEINHKFSFTEESQYKNENGILISSDGDDEYRSNVNPQSSTILPENTPFTPFIVPPGNYIVGEDIPSGTYRLDVDKDRYSTSILVNEPGKYGKTILYEYLGKTFDVYTVGKVELKDGYLVSISSGEITFSEYKGLFQ